MSRLLELSVIQTVPNAFLEASFTQYPILRKDKALRRLYCYMVHQQQKHGKVLLSADILAHIEDKTDELISRHYVAKSFIDRFSSLISPIHLHSFDGKEYQFSKGKAREGYFLLPQVLIDNWNFNLKGSRVYVDSLKPFSRNSSVAQAKLHHQRRSLAQSIPPISDHQSHLLDYLNNLPSNRFKSILRHIPQATLAAQQLQNPHSRQSSLLQLEAIQDHPMPFYTPSKRGRTERIFGDSFLQLPKSIRSILTQDWLEIDLEQAQLRILSHWWQCQPVIDFINSGLSLWQELESFVLNALPPGTSLSPESKEALKSCNKKLIYSTCYGMGLRNLKTNYRDSFQDIFPSYSVPLTKTISTRKGPKLIKLSIGEFICSHPLISSLLGERSKWIKKVRDEHGAMSPYGFVPLLKGMNPAAVLSTVAQAYEQKLMEPLLSLCSNDRQVDSRGYLTSRFQVIAWIHDGAILHLQDKRKGSAYLNKLFQHWSTLSSQLHIPISVSLSFRHSKLTIDPSSKRFSNSELFHFFNPSL